MIPRFYGSPKQKAQQAVAYLLMNIVGIIGVAVYVGFFTKPDEYYSIDNLEVLIVQENITQNNVVQIVPFNNKIESRNIGIALKINKKYLPGTKTERVFLSAGSEKGIKGIYSTVELLDIQVQSRDSTILMNQYFHTRNTKHSSTEKLSSSQLYLFRNNISLNQFVTDINNNARYTSGDHLDDQLVYFWLDTLAARQYNLMKNNAEQLIIKFKTQTMSTPRTFSSTRY